LKRGIVSTGGWLVIAWMIYLMVVTARTIPKIWDPYDVLGVSRVSPAPRPQGRF
jgi:translocation protein SEC63